MKCINLYHKEFQPVRTPPALRLAQIAGICLVLLGVAAYFWQNQRINVMQQQLHQAEATRQELTAELERLQLRLQRQQGSPELERRKQVLAQKLKIQRPLFATLERISARRGHCVEILATMAHLPLPDLWFTRMALDSTTPSLRFEGTGLSPDAISAGIDILMQQAVFSGQEFKHLEIKRRDDSSYAFILGSTSSPEGSRP